MFMKAWTLIVIGLIVAALAVVVFPLVQLQRDLRLANEQLVRAGARIAELENVVANLKTELDAANQARTQLQGGLEEANSEIEKRQSEVERLSAELEKATDLAKSTEAPHQEGDSASEPSDPWRPQ
jgi:chromosome segregation ATPase